MLRIINHIFIIVIVSLSVFGCSKKTHDELIASAEQHVQSNERQIAIVELKNAISMEPTNFKPRVMLGQVYLMQSQFEAAEKELLRGLELGAPENQVYPDLVRVYYYQNDYDLVIETVEKLSISEPVAKSTLALFGFLAKLRTPSELNLSMSIPDSLIGDQLLLANAYFSYVKSDFDAAAKSIDAYQEPKIEIVEKAFLNGLLARQQGDFDQAAKQFSAILEEYPNYHLVRFIVIDAYIKNEQLDNAEEQTDRLLEINNKHGQANYFKGSIAFLRKDYESAFKYSQLAKEGNFDSVRNQLVNGLSAFKLAKYEQAYTSLSRAAVYLPKYHNVHRFIAELQLNMGNGQAAVDILSGLSDFKFEDANLFALAGGNLINTGDLDLAIKQFNTANKINQTSSEFQLKEGLAKLANNDFSGVENIKKSIEIDNTNDMAWLLLAESYLDNGQKETALELAKHWQTINEADGWALEGQIYKRLNEDTPALQAFKKAIELEPYHAAANLNMLLILGERGEYHKLLTQSKKMLEHTPEDARIGLVLLKAANKLNKYDGIEAIFSQSVKQLPNSESALLMLATLKRMQGDYQDAINLLTENRKVLRTNGLMLLGDTYLKSGDVENAKKTYEQWREFNEDDHRPWLRLIGLASKSQSPEQILNMVNQALQLFPDSAEIALLKVHYSIRTQQYSRAKAYLAKLRKSTFAKNMAVLNQYAGELAIVDGNYQAGEQFLRQYYESFPNFQNARSLSLALQKLNKIEEAEQILLKHIEEEPNTIANRMQVAEFFAANQMFSKAKQHYEFILEKQPKNVIALNNLAMISLEVGELDKGLLYASEVTRLAPNAAPFLDTYGWALYRNDRLEEARISLTVALEKMPDSNATKLHLAEVELKLGNPVVAENLVRTINNPTLSEQSQIDKLNLQL